MTKTNNNCIWINFDKKIREKKKKIREKKKKSDAMTSETARPAFGDASKEEQQVCRTSCGDGVGTRGTKGLQVFVRHTKLATRSDILLF